MSRKPAPLVILLSRGPLETQPDAPLHSLQWITNPGNSFPILCAGRQMWEAGQWKQVGMGHKGHFTLCVTGIKTTLGTAQALNPLSGESVQRSGTVAGSFLELMPFSSRAICWHWREELGSLLWMLGPAKYSQQMRVPGNRSLGTGVWERSLPAAGPCRDGGRQYISSWVLIEQHLGTGRGSCEEGWASGAQKRGEMFREAFEMSDMVRLISKWNHNQLWSLNFVTVTLFLPFYLNHVKQVFWQHRLHINFVTWCLPLLSDIWSEYPIILFWNISQEFRLFKATKLPWKLNFSAQV